MKKPRMCEAVACNVGQAIKPMFVSEMTLLMNTDVRDQRRSRG